MKIKYWSTLLLLPTAFAAWVLAAVPARADAINKAQILRKAGGKEKGTLTNVLITTTISPNPPVTEKSFDREGVVKIPKKVGKAKSPGRDDGPYGRFDSEMFGTLKKATVKRNGRLIKYSGTGKVQAIDERESLVTGTTKAVSKIKGRKVISKGKVSGKRLLDSGLTLQEATGLTKGKGKY